MNIISRRSGKHSTKISDKTNNFTPKSFKKRGIPHFLRCRLSISSCWQTSSSSSPRWLKKTGFRQTSPRPTSRGKRPTSWLPKEKKSAFQRRRRLIMHRCILIVYWKVWSKRSSSGSSWNTRDKSTRCLPSLTARTERRRTRTLRSMHF